MAVLQKCPRCQKIQSLRHRGCECGENLEKARKSKRVDYWLDFRVGGKHKRVLIGKSLDEARDADGKRRVARREGRIFDIKRDGDLTFDDLAKWYLSLASIQQRRYYQTLRINLTSFLTEYGTWPLSTLKATDLEQYQAKRARQGYSDSYVDQEVAAARAMVRKAWNDDRISSAPVRVFSRVKKVLKKGTNIRSTILTKNQYDQLIAELPEHMKGIVAMGYFSGMRRGEILGLTWSKVDMKNRVVRLEASDTKDAEPRRVPICDELAQVLRGIPRAIHDDHVFLYRGKPIRDIRSALTRACEKVGLKYGRAEAGGFVFHDLRRTFNTNMRKAGVPESVIMAITGHSTREMFDRYNRIDAADTREAVNMMVAKLSIVD